MPPQEMTDCSAGWEDRHPADLAKVVDRDLLRQRRYVDWLEPEVLDHADDARGSLIREICSASTRSWTLADRATAELRSAAGTSSARSAPGGSATAGAGNSSSAQRCLGRICSWTARKSVRSLSWRRCRRRDLHLPRSTPSTRRAHRRGVDPARIWK